MKRIRVWAGASAVLLLALSGCSKNSDKTVAGGGAGVYSPVITGISADHEPAIRGDVNALTVLITNVNNYPITYHWKTSHGSLAESTTATVHWTAPDTVGNYPVTVSIESNDGKGTNFFKSTTFQIFVENEYTRWTSSPDVQFDPAPTAAGGVVFAQNSAAGGAEIYGLPSAGLAPEQITSTFLTAFSPSMIADGSNVVFAARKNAADSVMLWLGPSTGCDTTTAGKVTIQKTSPSHHIATFPSFSRQSSWLLYASDSAGSLPRLWSRQILTPLPSAEPLPDRVVTSPSETYWTPNWGPDIDHDGKPDSVICQGILFFHQLGQVSRGLFKFPSSNGTDTGPWLADTSAVEPDWSPDGSHVVFTRKNLAGDRDIWIINAASSNPNDAIRVTHGAADDSHPRFSPDGTQIFFVSNRVDRYGLNGVYNTERRGTNIWAVSRFDEP